MLAEVFQRKGTAKRMKILFIVLCCCILVSSIPVDSSATTMDSPAIPLDSPAMPVDSPATLVDSLSSLPRKTVRVSENFPYPSPNKRIETSESCGSLKMLLQEREKEVLEKWKRKELGKKEAIEQLIPTIDAINKMSLRCSGQFPSDR